MPGATSRRWPDARPSPLEPASSGRHTWRLRFIRAQQHHSDAAALHQRPGRRQRLEIDCQNALQNMNDVKKIGKRTRRADFVFVNLIEIWAFLRSEPKINFVKFDLPAEKEARGPLNQGF